MPAHPALHDRIHTVIAQQFGFVEPTVGVAVRDGVVTLSGYADSFARKQRVEQAIAEIPGIRAIAGGLHVVGDHKRAHSDTAIAHAVDNALAVERGVDLSAVSIRVENGCVTLTGRVHSALALDAIDRALECLSADTAIRAITSQVQFNPGPRLADGTAPVLTC